MNAKIVFRILPVQTMYYADLEFQRDNWKSGKE